MNRAESFGVRLRRLRQLQALSLRDVAASIGVSTTAVHSWEKGRARPKPRNLAALAAVLHVPQAAILLESSSALSPPRESHRVPAQLDMTGDKLLTLAEIIDVARSYIASFAQIEADRVKITLDL